MSLKVLSRDEIFASAPKWREPGASNYLAMYSSVFGGVVTDPALMVVPVDDHIINRGDAIFEYFPVVNGHAYCFNAHMTRLAKSAEIISLTLPYSTEPLRQVILETVGISGAKDCGVRLFATRGMGDFACDPTTPKKSELYVIVLRTKVGENFPARFLKEGASAMTTHVPLKMGFFAQVKTTDYVLNALVDLEAHRNNVDFGIWFDQDGHMSESSTENVVIVSQDGMLKYPRFEHMLRGTGLVRGVQLAAELVKSGELKSIAQTNITQHEVYEASELFGMTSGSVLPMVKFDGRTIGSGKPGPVALRLARLFEKDLVEGPAEVRTPVPYR
ncbi:MAG: aminotransferase class IV [Dehalococcoidia bacterium]|jgi:branched-chain amino acid aminotransferase|nr:aminotransferase class IV [Dehalococcoidia bacterium]